MTEFIEKLMPEEKPDLDRIELLAKNGGEPDVEEYLNEGNAIEARSKGGRALAQEAAGYGNLDILRLCVALGGDTRGALHLASMNGHLAAVKYLVEHVQVDINATNEQGYRPLACAFLHPDVQAYLLSRGGVR